MDTKVICLDIETYGIMDRHPGSKRLLPTQQEISGKNGNGRFILQKSLYIDRVPLSDLVLTCSLTLVKDPRCPTPTGTKSTSPASPTPWNASLIASIEPQQTMVLELWRPRHRTILVQWLKWADTILGMNLGFDLSYLAAVHPLIAQALGDQTLIDLSVVTYLENETTPERGLKATGKRYNTHDYDRTAKDRFSNLWEMEDYNAQDTHNTCLDIAEGARRILATFGEETSKLSPACVEFYSDSLWSTMAMTRHGVPFNREALEQYAHYLENKIARIERLAASKWGLILGGPGSEKSKAAFLNECLDAATACSGVDVRSHDLLQLTTVKKEISFNGENQNLILAYLPSDHHYSCALRFCRMYTHAQKLLGSYCYPYLWHRRKDDGKRPYNRTSILVPPPAHDAWVLPLPNPGTPYPAATHGRRVPRSLSPEVWTSHPSWYICPSATKDSDGAQGGTQQARIVCKKGAHQTDPPEIQRFLQSRFRGGYIVECDLDKIEPCVAGLLSGEPSILVPLRTGVDLYAVRAGQIFGEAALDAKYGSRDWLTKPKSVPGFKDFERDVAKHVRLADLYRSGVDTMRGTINRMAGVDIGDRLLRKIVKDRSIDAPQLWEWQRSLIKRATGAQVLRHSITKEEKEWVLGDDPVSSAWTTVAEIPGQGYLEAPPYGQSRYFLGGDKWPVNEIVNMYVQLYAGCVLLRMQKYIHERIRGRRDILMFLNKYDALYFDCKTMKQVEEAEALYAEALDWVSTHDLWAYLQKQTGRTLSLGFETQVH